MNGRIVVVDDVPTAFAAMVASRFADRRRANFSIAFSGGGTAATCYDRLAGLESEAIEWSLVEAYWGDERCVPLDDPDSNHRLVHEHLLDRVGPVAADHPMFRGGAVADAASAYDRLVRAASPIDLVHLGLGPDGHTASLFPTSTALDAPSDALVVANTDPLGNNPHTRLTFTYEAISSARSVIVTVEGSAKREAFARVRAGDPTAPASALRSEHLVWLVDREALGESDAGVV